MEDPLSSTDQVCPVFFVTKINYIMYKVQDYKTRRSLRHHQQWLHMEYIHKCIRPISHLIRYSKACGSHRHFLITMETTDSRIHSGYTCLSFFDLRLWLPTPYNRIVSFWSTADWSDQNCLFTTREVDQRG